MLEPNLTLFVTVAVIAYFMQVAGVFRNDWGDGSADNLEPSTLGLPTPLAVLTALTVLALTFALFPSDPRDWSLEQLVLYLATPSLEPIRILGVALIGAGLFSLVVFSLWTASGRTKRKDERGVLRTED